MKVNRMKLQVTAAMLSLGGIAAYGQNPPLTAKIPFAFRAVGNDLPSGNYRIARQQGATGASGTMELRNMDSGKAIFIPAKVPTTERTGDHARLIFHCAEGDCALETMWMGTGQGLEFATPQMTSTQRERHETISLEPYKEPMKGK
jgi:hypothetical protein